MNFPRKPPCSSVKVDDFVFQDFWSSFSSFGQIWSRRKKAQNFSWYQKELPNAGTVFTNKSPKTQQFLYDLYVDYLKDRGPFRLVLESSHAVNNFEPWSDLCTSCSFSELCSSKYAPSSFAK